MPIKKAEVQFLVSAARNNSGIKQPWTFTSRGPTFVHYAIFLEMRILRMESPNRLNKH